MLCSEVILPGGFHLETLLPPAGLAAGTQGGVAAEGGGGLLDPDP
jgi:hypothetical protein